MTQSELISKLNDAANIIVQSSVRGPANYMISSKTFVDYFNGINKTSKRKEKINKLFND